MNTIVIWRLQNQKQHQAFSDETLEELIL